MSFLELPNLPAHKKAVVCIWFMVTTEELAAMAAISDEPDAETHPPDSYCGICFSPPLYKTIPCITFGSHETTLAGGDLGSGFALSPCFIGIDCSFSQPRIVVNLQTAAVCSFNKSPVNPEDEIRPEVFFMSGSGPSQDLNITPDVPHCILISFDLTPACSITFANANRSPPDESNVISPGPTFSWTLDDVGKVGASMAPSGGYNWDIDDNYIIPQGLHEYFPSGGDISAFPIEDSTDFVVTVEAEIGAGPVGIPSSTTFAVAGKKITLAELQFFTGITADVTTEEVRRAFIKADGTPERDYSIVEALLGKEPEIRVSGATNWKVGNNSGTLDNLTKNSGGTINTSTLTFDISP